jgi:hypothetical protein
MNRPAKLKRTPDGASPDGTPIEHLFPINPETPKMLRGHGVVTVELCSRLTPVAFQTLRGAAQSWKHRAKRYLESAKNGEQPLREVIGSMSKDQRQELNELIDEERQAAWNAAVEQIAEGLELEIDNRAERANRIRLLKDLMLTPSARSTDDPKHQLLGKNPGKPS